MAKPSKTRSVMRATRVRLVVDRPELHADLLHTFRTCTAAAAELSAFLMLARGEPYVLRNGDGELCVGSDDLRTERARRGISDDHRDDLRTFFDGAVTAEATHVAPFVGAYKKRLERPTAKSDDRDAWKRAGLKLIDAGVLPIIRGLPGPFVKSVVIETLSRIKSWIEVGKNIADELAALDKEIAESSTFLRLDQLASEWKAFEEWVLTADELDYPITPRLMRNWRRFRYGESLAAGTVPSGPFDARLFEPLKGSPIVELVPAFCDHYFLLRRRSRRRESPAFTPPSPASPCWVRYGSNYVTVNVAAEPVIDRPRGKRPAPSYAALVLTVRLLSQRVPTGIAIHRLQSNVSDYLGELTVTPSESGHFWHVGLRRSGGDPLLRADLKEMRLCLDRSHLRRASASPFETGEIGPVLMELPLNIAEAITRTDEERELIRKGATYFTTAIGNATKEKDAALYVKNGLTVLSIDLGLSSPVAYAVGRLGGSGDVRFPTPWGDAAIIETGRWGRSARVEFSRRVRTFADRVDAVRRVINYARRFLPDRARQQREVIVPSEALALLGADAGQLSPDRPDLYSELRERLHEWTVQLRSEYRSIKHISRQRHNAADDFRWAEAIDRLISVLRSWSMLGKPPRPRGERFQPDDFETYRTHLRGVVRNLILQTAAEVKRLAYRHRAHVVLIEDLGRFRSELSRDRDKNRMLRLWSHRSIADAIKQATEVLGVWVVEVDPRHTSQLDPVTGEFGARNPDRSADLYVRRNGSIEKLDADVTAAMNLQRRYWTRFADVTAIEAVPSGDFFVPLATGQRIAGALRTMLGRPYGLLEANGSGLVLRAVTKQKFDAAYNARQPGRSTRWYYRHGSTWLDGESHRKEIGELLDAGVQASRSGQSAKVVSDGEDES